VTTTIQEVFPEKRITGMEFRRLLATAIFHGEINAPNVNKADFLQDYTTFINTSTKVIFKDKLIIIDH
jgi:hypothetical protein